MPSNTPFLTVYHGEMVRTYIGSQKTRLLLIKVVRPSSDRGSRCTDEDQSEKTEIKY